MSAGSAGVSMGSERAARAEMMPVPFTGPSALTAGQASRNFAQLQFEKETAKLGEVGAPLRERVENQTANMIRNFDALIDLPEPVAVDPRAIGQGVDRALCRSEKTTSALSLRKSQRRRRNASTC
jgi:hypothetical protein